MALGFRWLDGHTPLFLNFYKQHECLWNTKHKDYKNTLVRLSALNTLRSELNLPGLSVEDVKSKIKSIRTRYLVELHRIIASERNGDVVSYVPRLFWYNQADSFLRAVVSPKQKISDLVINNCQSEQAQDDSSNDGDALIETKAETEEEECAPPPKSTRSSERRLRSLSKRSRASTKHSRHFQVTPVENVLKKLAPETENEFDAFCRSLAIQLKNMPLDRALMCQENLQRVMTQERLSLYKNSGEDSKTNFVFYAEDPIETSEP